ncbi:MAG: hypothetical protein OXE94_10565, partial [Aestuariivita sp.]|nr:hypothetical protein [Aestuariivita sp.]MCY4203482.1 hypothetical protein [Aestuariivita sp.]
FFIAQLQWKRSSNLEMLPEARSLSWEHVTPIGILWYRRRFVSSGAEIRLYSDHRRKFGVGRKTLQLPSNSWSNVFRNIFVVALDV